MMKFLEQLNHFPISSLSLQTLFITSLPFKQNFTSRLVPHNHKIISLFYVFIRQLIQKCSTYYANICMYAQKSTNNNNDKHFLDNLLTLLNYFLLCILIPDHKFVLITVIITIRHRARECGGLQSKSNKIPYGCVSKRRVTFPFTKRDTNLQKRATNLFCVCLMYYICILNNRFTLHIA